MNIFVWMPSLSCSLKNLSNHLSSSPEVRTIYLPEYTVYFVFLEPKQPLYHCVVCKSPSTLQVTQPNWWSGLVEQLKNPCVDDKPSSFVTLNEVDRFHHSVWLNVGKHQREAGWLRSVEGLCIQETGILLCALCLRVHPPLFWLKNIFFDALPIFSIFLGHNCHHTQPPFPRPSTQLQNPRICNIASSSNIEILKNVWQRHKIANSRVLQSRWGNWLTKTVAKKSNCGRKNWKRRWDFFGCDFPHTHTHTHTHTQRVIHLKCPTPQNLTNKNS